MEIANCKMLFREGPVVVKVFAVHDPTLPLKTYKDQIEGEYYEITVHFSEQ